MRSSKGKWKHFPSIGNFGKETMGKSKRSKKKQKRMKSFSIMNVVADALQNFLFKDVILLKSSICGLFDHSN